MKKFIIFAILLLILAGGIYFAYPIIKNRYFSPAETETTPDASVIHIENTANKSEENMNQPADAGENASNISDLEKSLSREKTERTGSTPSSININERGTTDTENLAHITTENCDNDCKSFAMDLKLLEYCQQVCGIAPIKNVSNCDDKKDLEKDYCLKDLAINKKDSSLCGNIKDANIKLTCQNRIIQDIIEGQ